MTPRLDANGPIVGLLFAVFVFIVLMNLLEFYFGG